MKVTAETITDEQIRRIRAQCEETLVRYGLSSSQRAIDICNTALLGGSEALAFCAEIWNARHGGES